MIPLVFIAECIAIEAGTVEVVQPAEVLTGKFVVGKLSPRADLVIYTSADVVSRTTARCGVPADMPHMMASVVIMGMGIMTSVVIMGMGIAIMANRVTVMTDGKTMMAKGIPMAIMGCKTMDTTTRHR